MIRISIPYVYNLLEALYPLTLIKQGDTLGNHLFNLFNADNLLDQFINQSLWGQSLRVCRQPGNSLLRQIRELYGEEIQGEKEIEYWRVVALQNQLTSFKAVLEAEFLITAAYLVTPQRGYDVATLIESAEVIFPTEVVVKVPEVTFDLREAGKCIAFDLGTAAGFHLLRALETVIREYWNVVMEGKPLPSNRNLGNYIKEMSDAGKGDRKVLAALKQIKDHHRNELMHPEERLTLDEAIGLMGITQSAIVAMLKEIPERPTVLPPDNSGLLAPGGDIEPI
jgi:hypothetical protein